MIEEMVAPSPPARRPEKGSREIRVMIVDDSIVARAVLTRMLEGQADIAVVAQAGSGREAIATLGRTAVDVVLLDLEMPGMGGLQALPELIARSGARVLVVSSTAGDGAAASVSALRLGAADTLLKPAAGALAGAFAAALVDRLRRIMATAPLSGARPPEPPVVDDATPVPGPARPLECIAIGSSTGGVHALAAFFAAYPARVSVPILITQHLPPPFMPYFAAQLTEMSGRPTKVAGDGMPLTPGAILLAPGDAHLEVMRTRGLVHVKLARHRSASGCMPSVDPMLATVARVFGPAALGVILSGMGRDGAIGAAELKAAGGELLAQDAPSSVVWGMPRAVVTAGLASAALPPAELARRIAQRADCLTEA